MQTQLTFNIDSLTAKLVEEYTSKNDMSISELFESYLKYLILNKDAKQYKNDANLSLKSTDWHYLDKRLSSIRKNIPSDYKFDRELANER